MQNNDITISSRPLLIETWSDGDERAIRIRDQLGNGMTVHLDAAGARALALRIAPDLTQQFDRAIDWKPIAKAPRQELLLVGHADFKGWFAIAEMNALGEWNEGLITARRLERAPTHYALLNPPASK